MSLSSSLCCGRSSGISFIWRSGSLQELPCSTFSIPVSSLDGSCWSTSADLSGWLTFNSTVIGAICQSLGRRYQLSRGFLHQDRSLTITQHLEIFHVIVPSIFHLPDAFEELCLGNHTLQFIIHFFFLNPHHAKCLFPLLGHFLVPSLSSTLSKPWPGFPFAFSL